MCPFAKQVECLECRKLRLAIISNQGKTGRKRFSAFWIHIRLQLSIQYIKSTMGKPSAKKALVTHDPGCDPKILYNNYLQSCKYIGIDPSPSVKWALTNEDNPNRCEKLTRYYLYVLVYYDALCHLILLYGALPRCTDLDHRRRK